MLRTPPLRTPPLRTAMIGHVGTPARTTNLRRRGRALGRGNNQSGQPGRAVELTGEPVVLDVQL
eukprot:8914126-Lingulodinium_polyedra.AAC.1